MKRLITISLALIAVITLATRLTSCGDKPSNTSTRGLSKVVCDVSFQHILEQEIDVFEFQYPEANILARYMSEKDAFDSLMDKKVEVIIVSRDLTENQKKVLKAQGRARRSRQIAVDAVAIIVNQANDVDELTLEDLGEIMSGKVTTWGQVAPTNNVKNEKIQVVFDGNGTGVLHYMKDKFLGGKEFPMQVYSQKTPEDVFKAVEAHKGAVGFIGVSWISKNMDKRSLTLEERVDELNKQTDAPDIQFSDRIKVMPVRDSQKQIVARKPYQYYINSGEYPLFRTIYAIDASAAGTLDHGFYAFLTGVVGQKIILLTGIMPAAEPVRTVELQ